MTTTDKYDINRDCRMYREMFSYLEETARDMRGETERGSIRASDGRVFTVPEGAMVSGEIGPKLTMFEVLFK